MVENVPTPCGSILNLFRRSQLKSGAKSKNWSKFIKNPDFPYFPVFSPLLGATVPTPGGGATGGRRLAVDCSIHGLSDLYSQTLPSGESCPKGCL